MPLDQATEATGDVAAVDVASVIRAIALPSIEPFGSDNPDLTGLPAYLPASTPDPIPASIVSVARGVYDAALATLAELKRLEDATAACKASVVDRMMCASRLEAVALELDQWQTGISDSSTCSDIALTLCVPERTASALAHQSTELIASHPHTHTALQAGVLSWRHAVIIMDESAILAETPGLDAAVAASFEQRLLALAPDTTATGFASKARRARESTHPESLVTRTKLAYAKREMILEPGKDGMSWLTLHLPAPAAEGIWVNCTRSARNLKYQAAGDHRKNGLSGEHRAGEHRTLSQLRVDIAAALLLGQHPLPTKADTTATASKISTPRPNRSPSEKEFASVIVPPFDPPTPNNEPSENFGVCVVPDWAHRSEHIPEGQDFGTVSPLVGVVCDSPLVGTLPSDGSGYVDGIVDGIPEDPLQEYLEQLDAIRDGAVIADPPSPEAQILLTVPFLGALGITDEPAELAGYGPIPESIARKLLGNSGTFLRVLTDPVSNKPLDLNPERYRSRDVEKAVLRALAGSCYFPGCTNSVLDTDLDHLTSWDHGGRSTSDNRRPACKRHHILKHFKDDKDRHGRYRTDRDPSRAAIKLRGWTPSTTPDGRVGWRSPSGKYHPPLNNETRAPSYPKWIKQCISRTINRALHEPETAEPSSAASRPHVPFVTS
ncbi:hypothetical protein GCM10025779_32680 [Arthrobacter cryoconiti]